MAVFRIERNRDYTVMSNHHLRDTELSLKSKGLLSMMLSLPEEWNYTTRGLAAICKEGADCIGSALRELEQTGYIVRSRIRDSKGKIVDVEYIIYETPHKPKPQSASPEPERPDTENPDMDTPCPEMPAQLNKDREKKDGSKKDLEITDEFHPIPSYRPSQETRIGADGMEVRERYRDILYGINTHRLLVRGSRISYEETAALKEESASTEPATSTWETKYLQGVLWGVVVALGASIIIWAGTRIYRKARKYDHIPIAGVILTFVMCVELIQMVTERNNLHDIDTWMFFKWVFKTFCAMLIVTNTWNIVMGIFDVAQSVVNSSTGVIIGNTSVDISGVLGNLDAQMEALETGELFGLWFQSIFVGLTMNILSICIMLVVYGRMIEVYLTASVGPIPLATMTNRDWGHTGQNYLRSLFALGFQAFLIMVCVGIYSVLVQNIGVGSNVSAAIWACMGYTVLLCFALFKTGSLSKSLFGAH